ncbi:PepSY-associated TM helix domain-containing protein [Hyphomonas adhaerens MHS-3]|uniref:PepSY-associated TM helix domain-containing protein n=1 Tax=Hyphomonas adhaerens MHS-3 TaxID=1280949 RepID=A0A069E9J2_9PROT|nr:PepSY-associated TM helix domain-containing protein [Hyphomonas adhaerens]KCZ85976.1 PepSY-associated TM helix domain-containing protein [Hyphomonas adhaerens MHS-3]
MRRIFFWAHFSMGLAAGVFILLMSVTGVLLTYERQMVAAAQNAAVETPAGAEPLSVDALADAALAAGGAPGNTLTIQRNTGNVSTLSKGRRDNVLLDPYTGETLEGAGEGMEAFFGRVMRIHRWLAFTGGRNDVGAAINGAANLVFGALLISGIVLWWPRRWKWPFVKTQLFFRRGLPNAKARHYNWHHVLAAWSFVPLFLIIVSGAVFSYSWANKLVYAAFGETPGGQGKGRVAVAAPPPMLTGDILPLDSLIAQATEDFPNWRRVSITLPKPDAATLEMSVDWGNGTQASKKRSLTVARDGSGLIGAPVGDTSSPALKARRYLRFVHTGEIYGLIGQTLAGLASIAGMVLVYTGISLAIRRLIRMRNSGKA